MWHFLRVTENKMLAYKHGFGLYRTVTEPVSSQPPEVVTVTEYVPGLYTVRLGV